jgi:hypothetical protein
VLFAGFWKRIYYKYVIFDFHPIALFLFGGLFLSVLGAAGGIILVYRRIFEAAVPSSGTAMLVALPLITGLQLLLTALIMDVNNERRP